MKLSCTSNHELSYAVMCCFEVVVALFMSELNYLTLDEEVGE